MAARAGKAARHRLTKGYTPQPTKTLLAALLPSRVAASTVFVFSGDRLKCSRRRGRQAAQMPWRTQSGGLRTRSGQKASPSVQRIAAQLSLLSESVRDPIGVDLAHRRCDLGRPAPVHGLIVAGFEFSPSGRPQSTLRPFHRALQGRPAFQRALPKGWTTGAGGG
jgi:hypothetical protein